VSPATRSRGSFALFLYLLAFFTLLLEPFDFRRPPGIESFVPEEFSDRLESPFFLRAELSESVGHLLFLIPLAPLIAWRWQLSRRELLGCPVLATVTGLCLSSEAIQAFVMRDVSISDLAMDMIGYGLGVGAVHLHQRYEGFRRAFRLMSSPIPIIVALAVFVLAGCLLVVPVEVLPLRTRGLDGWEDHYPLSVGNERLGNLPWSGEVSQLVLFRRALPRSEIRTWLAAQFPGDPADPDRDPSLAAFYRFEPGDVTLDSGGAVASVRGLRGPVLKAVRSQIEAVPGGGLHFGGRSLLRGFGPACVGVVRAIRRSDEFTLLVAFRPTEGKVEHSGTIVSSACCERDFNFALAQEGNSLVLRLKTSWGGETAEGNSIRIGARMAPARLSVAAATYRAGAIRFFLDGREETVVRYSRLARFSRSVFEAPLTGRVVAGLALAAWLFGTAPLWILAERRGVPFPRSIAIAGLASLLAVVLFSLVASLPSG